jgi:hypothetical protein
MLDADPHFNADTHPWCNFTSVICIAETYEIGQLGESKQLQTCEREMTNSF